ncbi:MAG: phosphoglucosamine mutase [Bryobacteraceae bacterium]
MKRRLFGTDGIRGEAGAYPLDEKTIFAAGVALGRKAAKLADAPEVLIGIDTRESSTWIASLVSGGLVHTGARPRYAGLITTPGVAYLTRTGPFTAGVMISASHNPYKDNGIKIFGHSGYKFPDSEELAIEQDMFALLGEGVTAVPETLTEDPGLDAGYVDFLAGTFPGSLDGIHIVVDCAHGSASHLAPELFRRLGARVDAMACSPNGRNINLQVGALHVEALRQMVIDRGADLGVALDGDADRAMFVSHSGRIVNGDGILLITARHLLERSELSAASGEPMVVATVMSNLGLEKALERHGIRMLRTSVGDKYVIEEMLRRGAVLGGEQSGHIIFQRYATTGDGMLTALRTMEAMQHAGADLDQLTQELEVYPQRLVNIRVREKAPIEKIPVVAAEIRAATEAFAGTGRILVRYSGTEPLARVMVEGADATRVDLYAERISDAIRRTIGSPGD